jgi:hypothetical protein
VNQQVIARSAADNPEVVHERLIKLSVLERSFKAGILRHASSAGYAANRSDETNDFAPSRS